MSPQECRSPQHEELVKFVHDSEFDNTMCIAAAASDPFPLVYFAISVSPPNFCFAKFSMPQQLYNYVFYFQPGAQWPLTIPTTSHPHQTVRVRSNLILFLLLLLSLTFDNLYSPCKLHSLPLSLYTVSMNSSCSRLTQNAGPRTMSKSSSSSSTSSSASGYVTPALMYYTDKPDPRLQDFKPFDLEAWWGRRLYHNITKSL